MNRLKDVVEYLNGIKDINSGGCGIAAYAMYKWLEKNNKLADDTSIVFVEEEGMTLDWDEDYVMQGNARGVSHVMLFHKNKFYDSEGRYNDLFECDLLLEFDDEPIEFYIIDNINKFMKNALFGKDWENEWTSIFNRRKYLPKIEKVLGVVLN